MREQTYFILAALLDEPRHGYAIIQKVDELSQGSVKLAAGTLYAAIDRLHAKGYVHHVREEVVNGRARRYYGLTPDGRAAVRAEAERMVAAARVVTEHARIARADRRGFGAAVTA
ncbi:PadR family transcriptional regulator [Krasilnikovia sp. MM14-A1004]